MGAGSLPLCGGKAPQRPRGIAEEGVPRHGSQGQRCGNGCSAGRGPPRPPQQGPPEALVEKDFGRRVRLGRVLASVRNVFPGTPREPERAKAGSLEVIPARAPVAPGSCQETRAGGKRTRRLHGQGLDSPALDEPRNDSA